jgi:hypothetical protein
MAVGIAQLWVNLVGERRPKWKSQQVAEMENFIYSADFIRATPTDQLF